MSGSIQKADIQRVVLHGYGMDLVNHFLLTVKSAAAARAFIGSLAVTDSETVETSSAVSVALTFTGLQALGLPDAYMSVFKKLARAFSEGAASRAVERLGDSGRNEPTFWEKPFRASSTHVLLSVYADTPEMLKERIQQLTGGQPQAGGLSGWNEPIAGMHIGPKRARTEWFGFRDGISQPTIKGVHPATINPPRMHVEPGEFLLGHANEDNQNRWAAPELPVDVRRFVKNGCFVAFRKMQQHVDKFRSAGTDLDKAKMCGRWPNGALVEPGQTVQPATLPQQLNRFDFSTDQHGRGCPFGSHIRRLNPRTEQVVPSRKLMLMRRGMPYKRDNEVGLLGMFLCASLEGQFEFLQKHWVSGEPPMNPHGDDADPMIGSQQSSATFHIPDANGGRTLSGLGSFVTTRGTLYGFYPSVTALRMIAGIS